MACFADLSASLTVRDSIEQFSKATTEKYTRFADRSTTRVTENIATTSVQRIGQSPLLSTDNTSRQAQELIEAQKRRADLELRLVRLESELHGHRATSHADSKQINELSLDKKNLIVRLKDLEEEIKSKAKLLEDVHDEIVALTLQLNILEEKNKTLRQENDDLVHRWMVRMGQEAEAMNEASEFN